VGDPRAKENPYFFRDCQKAIYDEGGIGTRGNNFETIWETRGGKEATLGSNMPGGLSRTKGIVRCFCCAAKGRPKEISQFGEETEV